MKIKCLLVDDEPPAVDLMTTYIERVGDLEIVGRCSNAIEAFGFSAKRQKWICCYWISKCPK